EMERIADEVGLPPLRISFVAALRFVVDEWGWSTSTESPGAIPRHLVEMRDKIRRSCCRHDGPRAHFHAP
ncbi:MAG TPA: hypothetical protein VHE35_30935, partial [Kofleriaceae bacterium]|nr:hypothetical protein [Kofleriaceae bacterium]